MFPPEFNWDEYFSGAKFKDVRKNSPDLSDRRFPTTFSPDKKWIYLSSQDIDVATDNAIELASMLKAVKRSHLAERRRPQPDYMKLAMTRIDFITICGLLQAAGDSSVDYYDPDQLLEPMNNAAP